MATFANGINALGQIVGTCVEKTAKSFKLHGFFYTHGLYATFDHPTHWINPTGINVAGHIVGWYNGAPDGFLYINGLYATVDHPLAPSDTSVGDHGWSFLLVFPDDAASLSRWPEHNDGPLSQPASAFGATRL